MKRLKKKIKKIKKKIKNFKFTENDPGSLFGVGAFSVDVIITCI
jgi:hypothetical protein